MIQKLFTRQINIAKNRNILHSVLYGIDTKDMAYKDDTQSKLLAKPDQITEFTFHNVNPKYFQEYEDCVNHYYPIFSEVVPLKGSFVSDIGELDTGIHIWEFKSYEQFTHKMSILHEMKEYNDYKKDLRKFVLKRSNQINLSFSFWDPYEHPHKNNIFELRTYSVKPGYLLEWEHYWKKGLSCRTKYCQSYGAYFSQVGALHKVHHVWGVILFNLVSRFIG
eukprot:NODE_9_length_64580_cov_1.431941.p37 type:complete len:221 gc:universal NODE_9_length_64580_cov_1.431941:3704-3042(-)